jgi:molecular chaperone HscB
MTDLSTCWSCQGPLPSGALFCGTCGALSAQVSDDAFAVFGLPKVFDIDLKALEKAYFSASRHVHPDRFANKSQREHLLALRHTANLNAAYTTLKDDLSRAIYLLRQRGVTVFDEAGQGQASPALMAASFALHEALEEAATPQALQSLGQEVTTRVAACRDRLSATLTAGDVPAATAAALELRFLSGFTRDWQRKSKEIKDTA